MKRTVALILAMLFTLNMGLASEPFTVAARGAVLIDEASGRVLFGQNENAQYPMASTTKVMTTLLALENAKLDEPVTAGKNAHGVEGTSLYLSEGETLSMEHMLYGLMLRSGNDAAVAVAEHIAGSVSAFAGMMNDKAEALGIDAHFVNPHGLDAEGHHISALGLALLFREAMKNPQFRTITATQRKVIPWVGNEYSRVLENKNKLLKTYEGATGGKTGYTSKAGRCLVFSAERDGLELIGALLNCPSWFDTATQMLDWGFENFRVESALRAGERAASVRVLGGLSSEVDAMASEALCAAVPVGLATQRQVELPASVPAPVRAGQTLGTASLRGDREVFARCGLVAAANVEKRALAQSLRRLLRLWVLRLQSSPSA